MKQRILPFGFLSLLVFGIAAFLLSNAIADNKDNDRTSKSVKNENEGAIEYLASIRNNQHSGVINPADVIQAREQASSQKSLKSGNVSDYTWSNLGPDNMGAEHEPLFSTTGMLQEIPFMLEAPWEEFLNLLTWGRTGPK